MPLLQPHLSIHSFCRNTTACVSGARAEGGREGRREGEVRRERKGNKPEEFCFDEDVRGSAGGHER